MKRFALCLLLALASCHQTNPEPPKSVLRINFQDGDLPSTHPHIAIDYRMRSLQSALFEGLTRMDPDGIPQPAAAESISLSEDQKVYTFTLRPSVWSNGEPVTASHFATAWRQAIAYGSPCRWPDLFYLIKNSLQVKKGELPTSSAGIRVKDERTFEVELEHPAPYFLELITNPIFSPLYDESEEPAILNGPFVINEWNRDRSLSLRKNPLYWDAKSVHLEGIEIAVITDPLTAVALYERGELDWIGSPFSSLPAELIPTLRTKGELSIKEVTRVYWLYCNVEHPILKNASIRKGLGIAIDRQAIVDHVLIGQSAALAPLPCGLSLIDEGLIPSEGSTPLAREWLARGLAELGLVSFPKLTLSHSHISGQRQLAEVIQSNWRERLGIEVALEGSEWNHYFNDLTKGKYEIGGCIKSALFRDPIYHLELLEEKGNSYNVARWENQSYRELLAKARQAMDRGARLSLLRMAERLLLEEMPVIPVYSETYLYMIRPYIKGAVIHDLGHVDFKWINRLA